MDTLIWGIESFEINGKKVDISDLVAMAKSNALKAEAETKAKAEKEEKAREERMKASAERERQREAERQERLKAEEERKAKEQTAREARGQVDREFFSKPREWTYGETKITGTLVAINNNKVNIEDENGKRSLRFINRFSDTDKALMRTFAKFFPDKVKMPGRK